MSLIEIREKPSLQNRFLWPILCLYCGKIIWKLALINAMYLNGFRMDLG